LNNLAIIRLLLILGASAFASAAELPLMPMPQKVALGNGAMPIGAGFGVTLSEYSDARLESAVKRFTARVARQTGMPMSLFDAKGATLQIRCRERGAEYPVLGEDESYQLDVSSSGARLSAPMRTGVLRGLETFAQLIGPGPDGFQVPAVHIEDTSRFPWRGLMLDVARHWMPVAVIERNLDAMAAVKLNVFHWHLSDDQGFRIESKRYPKLQLEGSDGNFYTQAEVREIVGYARDRGIRVVPELDLPGHTSAWFVGYPELASAPGPYRIERKWGVFRPTMDPTREETYTFLDGLIGEMAALFPDPFFHIGGDEVEETQWKQSARIQAFARAHGLASRRDLQNYFNSRVEKLLNKHGKTTVGWDEVLGRGLLRETVIQSWRGARSLAETARQGYRSLLSFGYYLDHLEPAAQAYANDPLGGAAGDLTPQEQARILGGEACMWSEYVSAETVDSRIWPRMIAIAERFWSPRSLTDTDSMYERLERVGRWLRWTGVQEGVNEPLLERLTGNRPAGALRVLADASEALGLSARHAAREYTSLVPLNRFVDAVPPESELVRRLERDVSEIPQNPAALAELRAAVTAWANLEARLQPLLESNVLKEVSPLAGNLSRIGNIGAQALEWIESGHTPPKDWIEEQSQELDKVDQPVAEVRLAAARVVRALVARTQPKRLANEGVRCGNEPLCNGLLTVPNWTLGDRKPMIALKEAVEQGGRSLTVAVLN
jgi:hexosaminidase